MAGARFQVAFAESASDDGVPVDGRSIEAIAQLYHEGQ
jgi:hypothetical protein